MVRKEQRPSRLLFSLGLGMKRITGVGPALGQEQLVREEREKQSFAVASFVTRATATNR